MRSYNHYNTMDDEMTAQFEMAKQEVRARGQIHSIF
jgi:hypothetical protein